MELKIRLVLFWPSLHKKMKFSIKDFFGKCDQFRSFLQIWSHFLKKSLMENFIFCAVHTRLQLQGLKFHIRNFENLPMYNALKYP